MADGPLEFTQVAFSYSQVQSHAQRLTYQKMERLLLEGTQ